MESGKLKLHINLGAGESELSSSKGTYLNDTQWHHVSIIRREANLTMKVFIKIVINILNLLYCNKNILFTKIKIEVLNLDVFFFCVYYAVSLPIVNYFAFCFF